MKKITKVLAIVMTLAMLLSMTAMVASAAGSGSITIENPYKNEDYTIVKLFDATLGADGEINYTSTTDIPSELSAYFVKDAAGNITATDAAKSGNGLSEAAVNALTAWAKAQPANAKTTINAGESTEVKFENLDYGYYVVLSTMGAAISVDSVNPNVTIKDKNEPDVIIKGVHEDTTAEGTYGDTASAQIGQAVPFKLTITAHKNSVNLVAHDKMSEGLTFNADTMVVKVGETTLTAGSDYNLLTGDAVTDGCTFDVVFTEAYLKSLTGSTTIEITYTATLNDKAKIADETNPNTTWLTYGNHQKSDEDTVEVLTYSFDLVKTTNSNKLLAGAEFDLYDALTGGNQIALVDIGNNTYRVATDAEKAAEGFTSAKIVTNDTAPITIVGVDCDTATTYYLEETEAPAGYNKLIERVTVKMMADGQTTALNLDATMKTEDSKIYQSGGVHVVNEAGVELPETGGIGTTLFVLFGSMTALCAAVVLVARKKTAGYR